MTMFTLSARAVYPGGSRGAVFARYAAPSPLGCVVAMAGVIARWMPPWRHADGGRLPQAIEFRLGWREEEPVPSLPAGRPGSGMNVACLGTSRPGPATPTRTEAVGRPAARVADG